MMIRLTCCLTDIVLWLALDEQYTTALEETINTNRKGFVSQLSLFYWLDQLAHLQLPVIRARSKTRNKSLTLI